MISTRTFARYLWTFKRRYTPPLQKPRESPYIVGPYLKPDYVPREYITDPIKEKHDDDLDHFIYEPTEIPTDESRTVSLLLINDVEGIGTAGQIVNLPFRLGASRLIAMRKAEYLTDFSKSWFKFGERTLESASTALSPRTARGLQSKIYILPVSKTAQLKSWHISLALRLAGVQCPVEAIPEESINRMSDDDNCDVTCIVVINNHEKVEVKFKYVTLSVSKLIL